MLAAERTQSILDRINADQRVAAVDLAREFDVSEDTIRRDLRDLAARGLCRKVYGGALALPKTGQTATERSTEALQQKDAIGRVLASRVSDGQFVFLDSGSTNLAAARALAASRELTVATHDPKIAAVLADAPRIDLIVVGGRINHRSGAALGSDALDTIKSMRPEVLLLGACAIDVAHGVSSFDYEDARFKTQIIAQSGRVITGVHSEKIAASAGHFVCAAATLDELVLESTAPDGFVRAMQDLGTSILTVT